MPPNFNKILNIYGRQGIVTGLQNRGFESASITKNQHGGTKDKEPGWFSRMLGIQHIEPFNVAHSSMLADKETVYELVKHRVIPAQREKYMSTYQKYVDGLKEKKMPAEILGSWNVNYGDQDQMIHLWKYNKGYEDVDTLMESFSNDKQMALMQAEQAQLCLERSNCILLAFSFWGDPKPRPPKHIYELRTYVLKAGTMMEWGNNWIKGIQNRRDYNQNVGGFFTQIGKLYKVYHLWAYESMAARKRIREETWLKPGWDTNVAYTVPLIRSMESKIMLPNTFSPMQ